MDISKWTIEKILQLPDHMFGYRWWVSVPETAVTAATRYYMSPLKLPDHTIIWRLHIYVDYHGAGFNIWFSLALGVTVPTNDAEFGALPLLMPSYAPRRIYHVFKSNPFYKVELLGLRNYVHSKGRNLIIRVESSSSQNHDFHVGLLISALPTSIPDELLHPPLLTTEYYLKKIWQRIKA